MKSKQSNDAPRGLRRLFNLRLWSDADRVNGFFNAILAFVSGLFVVSQQKSCITFDDAMRQYDLTESGLLRYQRALLISSLVCLSLVSMLLIYALYRMWFGQWMTAVLTGALMVIGLGLAFRYHFWYMQISKRKLGCSWREWVEFTFKRSMP